MGPSPPVPRSLLCPVVTGCRMVAGGPAGWGEGGWPREEDAGPGPPAQPCLPVAGTGSFEGRSATATLPALQASNCHEE